MLLNGAILFLARRSREENQMIGMSEGDRIMRTKSLWSGLLLASLLGVLLVVQGVQAGSCPKQTADSKQCGVNKERVCGDANKEKAQCGSTACCTEGKTCGAECKEACGAECQKACAEGKTCGTEGKCCAEGKACGAKQNKDVKTGLS
jgi:hypothetical protein